ncbi:MAG: DUF2764 family protein [Bacteroidales bacterium]|jgi:hypothetical protein|nr:DUF2764 family protein [Bacteroidales bacterium]
MAERNYYALVAGLPDIVPEEKRSVFSSVAFRQMLHETIHPSDFDMVKLLHMPFDHNNLLKLLYGSSREWDERANYTAEEMEALKERKSFENEELADFPQYIIDFIEIYLSEDSPENIYVAEQLLISSYYKYLEQSNNQFIREWVGYQSTIANVMAALNGRKHNIPFEDALVGDNEVVSALKKSRARDFGLSTELPDIEQIIQLFEIDNLLERELKIDNHKWHFLDELTFFNYFSVEKILAFVLKLFIVERWMTLDIEKGKGMFNKLLKEYETGFQFPEEFTLAYGKK